MRTREGGETMLYSNPEDYRKELNLLSGRLQALKEDFRQRGMISDADHAVLDKLQREQDRLAARLSDAEDAWNWDRIKREFEGEWNTFVADLELLELPMQDAEGRKRPER
jgi:hypothetical protein